jgi:MFS family permease
VSPFSLLRRPDYLRLWACGALLGTLRWLEVLAVGLFTLERTGSAFLVAAMLFARTLPMVLLGAFMGTLADRVQRRRLLAAGIGLMAVSAATLCALAFSGALELWHVAAGAIVNGSVWTMEHPVRRALIGDLVGGDTMGAAISLDSATFNATRMLGPIAGGAVFAAFGLPGAYLVGAFAYGAALWLVLGLPPVAPHPGRAPQGFWPSLGDGLGYVRARPVLAGVMAATVVANLFGFSYAAMVPVLGERVLALDAPGIGLLMAMEGLGASLGAVILAFVIRPAGYARVFTLGALVFLLMVLAFALALGERAGAALAGHGRTRGVHRGRPARRPAARLACRVPGGRHRACDHLVVRRVGGTRAVRDPSGAGAARTAGIGRVSARARGEIVTRETWPGPWSIVGVRWVPRTGGVRCVSRFGAQLGCSGTSAALRQARDNGTTTGPSSPSLTNRRTARVRSRWAGVSTSRQPPSATTVPSCISTRREQ